SLVILFFSCSPLHLHLHSFPTRRSSDLSRAGTRPRRSARARSSPPPPSPPGRPHRARWHQTAPPAALFLVSIGRWKEFETKNRRSEEHTSEFQSRGHLVCRLLLEKKNKQ